MAAASKRPRLGESLHEWRDKPDAMFAKLREGNDSDVLTAIKSGHTRLLAYKIERGGFDINQVDPKTGKTALHEACARCDANAIELLLAAGADTEAKTAKVDSDDSEEGLTPLLTLCGMRGATIEAVDLLLDAGADAKATDKKGRTVLHMAVETEIVKILMDVGADAMASDEDGNMPLHEAARAGKHEIARELRGLGYTEQNEKGMCPIHVACVEGWLEAVQAILYMRTNDKNIVCSEGMTPLMYACNAGHYELAGRLLFEHGADVTARCEKDWTAVDYAIDYRKWAEEAAEEEAEGGEAGWDTIVSLPNANKLIAVLKALGGEEGDASD
jgi:ankyrin repeat protein